MPYQLRALSLALALFSTASAQDPVFLHFDQMPADTSVQDLAAEFAEHGVNFYSDYSPETGFRAAPFITSTPNARTAPHVLVNRTSGGEIFSSQNVPLRLWFSQAISGVGMQLGCLGDCNGAVATVTLYDCEGNVTAQATGTPRPDFVSPLQVLDPTGTTRSVSIDYGDSLTPEAIDDLAFQPAGAPCLDQEGPVIVITSHSTQQTLLQREITLAGRVSDNSGIVKLLRINGERVGLTPLSPPQGPTTYAFRHPLVLEDGSNSIVVKAWDSLNNTDVEYLTLHVGAPATVELAEFHLTQRGIMRHVDCDIDGPMVAGKSTIVRARFRARTAAGALIWVDGIRMSLLRQTTNGQEVVNTIWGELYSPQTSTFQSAGDLAAVHFWIDGSLVDQAGSYSMQFQPFLGVAPLGPPLSIPCPDPWIDFTETDPIRLLLVPLEAQLFDANLPPEDHRLVFEQLALLARSYPVRDGFSSLWNGDKTGVKWAHTAPHILCDGSAAMKASSRFCCGTGFEWTFKDAHPDGLWRSTHEDVEDPTATSCAGDHVIGGRILGDTLVNLPRATKFGYWSPGAPPTWNHIRFNWPLDDNHNGTIADDLQNYLVEFLDKQTGQWSKDFTKYSYDEVVRSFEDRNGDYCWNKATKEPPSPAGQKWLNTQDKILVAPALQALADFNNYAATFSIRADYASLWLAPSFHPRLGEFHMFGPGQGQQNGRASWVSPGRTALGQATDNILPNELAHNFGFQHTDEAVPAWQAYAGFRRVNPAAAQSMNASYTVAPDAAFFTDARYQEAFDKLKKTAKRKPEHRKGVEGRALSVCGVVSDTGRLSDIATALLTSGQPTELPATSPYHIVMGARQSVLADYPIEVTFSDSHFDQPVVPLGAFQAILPFPEEARWIRFMAGEQTLWQADRTTEAPSVEVLSPADGEHYAASDVVEIRWETEDPDSEEVTFSVFYSPDGGRWQSVATGLTGREYAVNASTLPAGDEAKVRIVACDGFNVAEGLSDGFFTVDGKPPVVAITSPQAGQRFLQWDSIPLEGFGFDPDGLALTASWTLNGNTVADRFTTLLPPQEPGEYLLELETSDPSGERASTVTNFVVLADSDRDGMSDLFEDTHGLRQTLSADALDDLDGDGLLNFDEAWRGTDPRNPDSDQDGLPDGREADLGRDPALADAPVAPIGEAAIYTFEGEEVDPGLQVPMGGFQFLGGDVLPIGPRSYVRTIASDFNEVDFQAELHYTTNGGDGPAGLFFGMGSAVKDPAFFDEPLASVYFLDHAEDFFFTQATVVRVHEASALLFDPIGWPTPQDGRQTLRLTKSGDLLTFEMDYLADGAEFTPDFAATLHLLDDLGFLNRNNSHLFFGTDLGPTVIHELRITRTPSGQGLPALEVIREGDTALLSWPREFSDFHLQTTTDLNPPTPWSDVHLDPIPRGSYFELRIPLLDSRRFFRLAR